MKYFQFIGNVDTQPLYNAVLRQPELWNANPFRTTRKDTAMINVDDILLRFCDTNESRESMADIRSDSATMFYPAWDRLPQVKPIVFDLMRRVEGYSMGRVIISRLKPGADILAHADNFGDYITSHWRYHIALNGYPGSHYFCGPESNTEMVDMLTGQVWWFDHREMHYIKNDSTEDRIHLMVDFQIRN